MMRAELPFSRGWAILLPLCGIMTALIVGVTNLQTSWQPFKRTNIDLKEFQSYLESIPTASLPSTVLKALELRERFRLSYWDAAIIAAARDLGCHTIYSEDFSHGQDYDGVRVVNPFLPAVSE